MLKELTLECFSHWCVSVWFYSISMADLKGELRGVPTVQPKLSMGCDLLIKDDEHYYFGMSICVIHLCTLISIRNILIL